MASSSVDQKNNYVFGARTHMIEETASRSVAYWSTANGDDTMVTLWNPADEAQDFIFSLFFVGGHYRYPVHLGPRSTHMFNLSEIVRNQMADDEGNVIPAAIHEGSAQISGSRADNEHILVAIDAAIYNVRKATCHNTCVTCNGAVLFSAADDPFSVSKGGTHQLSFKARWNTGTYYDLTTSSKWSSSQTSLATVGASTGMVAGVAPGAVTMTATTTTEPIFLQECDIGASCLADQVDGGSGSTNGTVTPPPTITGIAPGSGATGSRVLVTISGSNFGSNAAALSISGISGTVSSVNPNGTQIGATFDLTTLAPGNYSVVVNLANGDGGSSPSNSWPFVVNPVQVNTAEMTVIGWVNSSVITLPSGENSSLQAALNVPLSCDALLAAWAAGTKTFLSTSADFSYANAFLIKGSGNAAPPATITPATQLAGGDFRLFNDVQVSFFESNGIISSSSSTKSTAAVGSTPDPCGLLPKAGGQAHPSNGAQGITPSATGVYQLAEGRVGTTGQAVSFTLNGRTVPWIWNVIEFDASGNPTTTNDSIFPTYYVYKNGVQVATYPQGLLSAFIALDATYQLLPSQIQ